MKLLLALGVLCGLVIVAWAMIEWMVVQSLPTYARPRTRFEFPAFACGLALLALCVMGLRP